MKSLDDSVELCTDNWIFSAYENIVRFWRDVYDRGRPPSYRFPISVGGGVWPFRRNRWLHAGTGGSRLPAFQLTGLRRRQCHGISLIGLNVRNRSSPLRKKKQTSFLPVQAFSAKQGVNYGGVFLVGRDRDGVLGLDWGIADCIL